MKASLFPTAGQLICSECFPSCGDALPHIALLIDEFNLQFVDKNQFCEACERGVSTMYLEFFLSRTAPFWQDVIRSAAKGGHKHVLQWLMTKRVDGRGPWKRDFSCVLHELAAHGHLQVLKWIFPQVAVGLTDYVMTRAAGGGHVEVVQWLHGRNVGKCWERPIQEAAGNGHLKVVKWLHKQLARTCVGSHKVNERSDEGENPKLPVKMNEFHCFGALDRAVANGHLDVVRWLHQNCGGSCSSWAIGAATRHGHLSMVQWLHVHFGNKFDKYTMDKAAENGHLNVLKWLRGHRSDGCTATAIERAALKGHLDVLKWLHLMQPEDWTPGTMEYAARSGHLDVVQWLYENRPEVRTVNAIDSAARQGRLNVAKWLHKRTGDVCSDRALEDAALGGHLEMVCWLEKNTRQRAAGWGFAEATKRGYLEVMRLWFEKNYGIGRSLGLWGKNVMQRCSTKILKQLSQAGYSFTSASGCDDTTCQFLKTLERYHNDGFRVCANVMLQSALEAGYIVLVQRFFEKRSDRELEKYVEIAAEFWQWTLLRWLLENGAQLTTQAANLFMKRGVHVEVTWWLSESDRVKMACKTLLHVEDSSELLLWLLENTKFVQKSSRKAIGEAIRAASDDIRHLLRSSLTDSSICGC